MMALRWVLAHRTHAHTQTHTGLRPPPKNPPPTATNTGGSGSDCSNLAAAASNGRAALAATTIQTAVPRPWARRPMPHSMPPTWREGVQPEAGEGGTWGGEGGLGWGRGVREGYWVREATHHSSRIWSAHTAFKSSVIVCQARPSGGACNMSCTQQRTQACPSPANPPRRWKKVFILTPTTPPPIPSPPPIPFWQDQLAMSMPHGRGGDTRACLPIRATKGHVARGYITHLLLLA
jgi:hypothetical protein